MPLPLAENRPVDLFQLTSVLRAAMHTVVDIHVERALDELEGLAGRLPFDAVEFEAAAIVAQQALVRRSSGMLALPLMSAVAGG